MFHRVCLCVCCIGERENEAEPNQTNTEKDSTNKFFGKYYISVYWCARARQKGISFACLSAQSAKKTKLGPDGEYLFFFFVFLLFVTIIQSLIMIKEEKQRDIYRWGLLIFTTLYVFFFAGAYYGYGPMILMLLRDDAFRSECDDVTTDTTTTTNPTDAYCPDQMSSLLNVHFVGMVMQIWSPILGAFADKRGPMITMILTTVLAMVGVILLIISRTFAIDWILYPSFISLQLVSCCASIMINGPTGSYFAKQTETGVKKEEQEKDNEEEGITEEQQQQQIVQQEQISDKLRRRVIGFMNNIFDGGSITYLIMWEIMKSNPKLTLEATSIGYLALGVVIFGGALFFWKRLLDYYKSTEQEEQETEEETAPPPTKEELKAANKEDWKILREPSYLWLVAMFTIHQCRNTFNLTSQEAFLAYLGDDDRYIEIFAYILPASIIGFPAVDYILDKYGYHVGLQSINVLAAIHGIIQVSSNNLNVQIVGFVAFSFYRCFIFSIIFAFNAVILPGKVLGKASGIMFTVSGLAMFVNIPLGDTAIQKWGGNFFIPNLIYTIAIVPCFFCAWRCGAGLPDEFRGGSLQKEEEKEKETNVPMEVATS